MKFLLVKLSLFFIVAVTVSGMAHGQSLNNYKYVIVDNQYEFQNEANEYRLNEMMVFEIKKRGIEAFRNTTVLPEDMNLGTCNALTLRVNKIGGLRVKMTLEFVNCSDEVVFTTKEGIGRTKNFEIAYREALRDAMSSLDELEYVYEPVSTIKRYRHSEGPDTIVTNQGRPGDETPVQEMPPSAVKPSSEITPSNEVVKNERQTIPKPELVELVGDKIYLTNSKEYKIQSTDTGFNMYKNNSLIGTLKKSTSGCYLSVTTEFIGIGYEKENAIIIEYDKNGTQFLVFQKQ